MLSLVATILFAVYVLAVMVCGLAAGQGRSAARRKIRTSLLLLYAVGASFGAGLTQRDCWPFVAWPLIAGRLPAYVTLPRLVGVDSGGGEHDIDYRAWWPLSFDELLSWMNGDFLKLNTVARDRVAQYLTNTAELARARARAGAGVGHFDRVLGPATAPFFLLHPAIWSDSARVPAGPFKGLRLYRETWNLDARARGNGAVQRLLLHEYLGGR